MAGGFDPSAVFAQMVQSYLKLPLAQKIVFPMLIVASFSGIIYVSKWANRPDYVVLYSDIEPADASAVIERLKTQRVKYEVRGDGRTIAVSPPELVSELRIGLASEGLPRSGNSGYELFDGTSLGVTTFVEKIKGIRALQGELERTITSLDPVASARVHITQPEKTVFAKQGDMPTASVMIRFRPGGELDRKQIKGISNLVAGSVPGLKPDAVTIVDVYGNLLTQSEKEDAVDGIEASRLQYQREIEHGFVARVEQMLAKVLGPGRAVARVTAEMDFSLNEREEESYDPGGQVLRSEKSIEEGVGSSQRGGVPGVVSNLTNDPALLAPQGTGDSASNRREAVKNYEVSRAVTKVTSPRGKITRLSVAVLVDGLYEATPGSGPNAPKQFSSLPPDTLRQIEGLVKSAVGFDSARGDIVTVENIQFYEADSLLATELDKKADQDFYLSIASKAFPWFFALMFFLVLVKPLVKFLVTPTDAEVDLSRLLPTGIQELEKELESERVRAAIPSFEPAVDLEQLEELLAENARVVKENPQQAALLIRYWLNDGRL